MYSYSSTGSDRRRSTSPWSSRSSRSNMWTPSSTSTFSQTHNTATTTDTRMKIIAGIDYGTTYTGISWVESTAKSFEDIRIIRTWPGPSREADETWKTPSRIAYASENKDMATNQWGFLVTPKMKSYAWTKLLLDKSAEATEFDDPSLREMARSQGDGMLKLPHYKPAIDVAADYLTEIYKYFVQEIEKRLSPEIVRVTPFEFWFTVPAMWDDKAKKATYEAAKMAGFASRTGDSIYLLPEPQAAAVAVLKSLTSDGTEHQIRAGDGILICDGGGGTVDLTTYCIKQASPNLLFDEMLVGAGGKCGSTWIDREFHHWMSRIFGVKFDDIKFEKKGPGSKFMKEFEYAKRDFRGMDDPVHEFEVSLVIPGAVDSQYYDSDESIVKIAKQDMLGFFNPVIEKVLLLLNDQVDKVNADALGYQINTIILVGGFGDSPYLNEVLKSWCRSKGNIRLLCPPNPQAAVVKGAALTGLEGTVPTKKLSRRWYGCSHSHRFREGIDPEDDAYYDRWDNKKYCKRMIWHVKKGSAVTAETHITLRRTRVRQAGDKMRHTYTLYCCKYDSPPERYYQPGVEEVGKLSFDWSTVDLASFDSKIVDGERLYNVSYVIQVSLGSREGMLLFKVVNSKTGEELGKTDLEYVMSD